MIHAGNNSCDSSINYCCLNVPDRQHGEDVTADYNKRTTILLCPVRLWRSWRSIGNTPVNHFTWTWKELLLCSIDTWCPHDVNHHIARRCVHFFLCAGFSVAHVIKRGKGLCVCVCVCVCQNIQICKISVCWLFHLNSRTCTSTAAASLAALSFTQTLVWIRLCGEEFAQELWVLFSLKQSKSGIHHPTPVKIKRCFHGGCAAAMVRAWEWKYKSLYGNSHHGKCLQPNKSTVETTV